MTPSTFHRLARGAAIISTVLVTVVGCGKSERAASGDTGTAAPATQRNMSATPGVPDSTTGVSNPTGQPSTPGDTLGARGLDTTKGPRAGSPVGTGAVGKP